MSEKALFFMKDMCSIPSIYICIANIRCKTCPQLSHLQKYAKAQDMKSLFRICFFCYFNNGSQKSELINCLFIEELVKKGFGVGRHLHFWMNDGTTSKVVFFLKRDTKKKNPPPSPSWCGNGVVVIESEENFSPTFQLFFFKFDTIQRLSISKL